MFFGVNFSPFYSSSKGQFILNDDSGRDTFPDTSPPLVSMILTSHPTRLGFFEFAPVLESCKASLLLIEASWDSFSLPGTCGDGTLGTLSVTSQVGVRIYSPVLAPSPQVFLPYSLFVIMFLSYFPLFNMVLSSFPPFRPPFPFLPSLGTSLNNGLISSRASWESPATPSLVHFKTFSLRQPPFPPIPPLTNTYSLPNITRTFRFWTSEGVHYSPQPRNPLYSPDLSFTPIRPRTLTQPSDCQ